MIAKAEIMDWPPGAHASTFGGNPISCAAALATIQLLEDELIENAARMGELLMSRLQDLEQRHTLIGNVRGKGLMIGVELVSDRGAKTPAVAERDAVLQSLFQKGLLLLGCGTSALRFAPPLIVDSQQVETAIQIVDEALNEIE